LKAERDSLSDQHRFLLARYPYIQKATPHSVLIAWRTDRPTDSLVEYGPTPNYGLRAYDPKKATDHALTIEGLEPDTAYYYRVLGDGQVLTQGDKFHTNKDERNPFFTFLVFGDSGSGKAEQYDVARRIELLNPDLGIVTGDVIYENGEAANFDPYYFDVYKNTISRIAFYPSLGNHDIRTENGEPYIRAFYLPGNERYYSFDYANAHFVALDSNVSASPESDQYRWLKRDLEKTDKFWKFVYFHHPPYSSWDLFGGRVDIREAFSPLFERYGVDIVFSGHDHNYERSHPIRDYYPEGKGVVYIITGGGGKSLDVIWRRSAWTSYIEASYHVTYVEIKDRVLELKAIRPDGTVMDALTIDRSNGEFTAN